jgi:hypothetical protein
LSVRYLNEITKIKRSDSTIIWRLGGKKNQFTFVNDPQKFIAQHDIRRIKNGHLTLFDNGREGTPLHAATAKEYRIDEKKLQINLVWSYKDNNKAISKFSGSVQRLSNGNTLVNYGTSPQSRTLFNVVKPSGSKVFEIIFQDTLSSYRAFNYPFLPWKLKRPIITCFKKNQKLFLDAGSGHSAYRWSTGDTTQTISVSQTGDFSVFVPISKGGFISSEIFSIKDLENPERKKNR